jgi:hypothetical protein
VFINLGDGTHVNARLILCVWVPPPTDPARVLVGDPATVYFTAAPPVALSDRQTAYRLLGELARWPGFVLLRRGHLAVNFEVVSSVSVGDRIADVALPGFPDDLSFYDEDVETIRARVWGTG